MLICPVVSFITLEGEFPEFAVHFLIPPKVSGGLILDWVFFVGCGSASGDRANSTWSQRTPTLLAMRDDEHQVP